MMKKITFASLMLATMLMHAHLVHAKMPASVASALKRVGIPQSGVAIFVQPVDGEGPTLSVNAGKKMNPASVMKLVTTYAGLELLKPSFRWKTELYTSAPINNGVLDGDLIIKGYGDPSFKENEFKRLLVSLQQRGVNTINGDFVIDKTYFAPKIGNTKPFDSEIWRSYNTAPSALLVNGAHTSFKFTVNNENQVIVSQEVELPEVEIVNQMVLKKGGCGSWRNHYTYDVNVVEDKAVVTFDGAFSASCGDRYIELSLFDDEQYAYFMFKKLWRGLGGKFTGNLRVQQSMPANATKLLEQGSKPLAEVIRDINK